MLEGMNRLTYYGPANLIGTLFLIIFLIVSFKKYGKSDDYETQIKPIKFSFWMLVILEIAKIIYHIYTNGDWNPRAFPIIYCSSAMYVYGIVAYGKKDSLAVRISLFASVLPFVVIGSLYWVSFPTIDWNSVSVFGYISNIHSRFYHFVNLSIAFYILGIKLYRFEFKDWFAVSSVNALYFVFATFLSLFMGGEVSNFGPNSNEVKYLYNLVGYATGNLIIIFLVYIFGYAIFKIIDVKRKKQENNNQIDYIELV